MDSVPTPARSIYLSKDFFESNLITFPPSDVFFPDADAPVPPGPVVRGTIWTFGGGGQWAFHGCTNVGVGSCVGAMRVELANWTIISTDSHLSARYNNSL